MGLPRSTYYDAPVATADEAEIVARIEAICEEFEAYGYRRVGAALRHQGHHRQQQEGRRLMREHDLQPRRRKRFVATTDSDHDGPIFPNLAKDVTADGPNQLWVADITYVAIAVGFVYVAVILDAWSRRVVGYAISRSIDARLTIAALKAAIRSRRPPAGCIHHSDRGSQGRVQSVVALWHRRFTMTVRRRRSDRSGRSKLHSPGRPDSARREELVRFWAAIATGRSSEDAARDAGVSPPVGSRWFRRSGGMPPSHLSQSAKPLSGRYLSFEEREEIALLRAQGRGIRHIACRLERAPSTISREVRRNAATRSGGLDYRATTAQWHADRSAKRPKPAKLATNEALRRYVQDRLAGRISAPDGTVIEGPRVVWNGRRHGPRQHRRGARAWSPEQIAHRLRIDYPGDGPEDQAMRISHEAIYQGALRTGPRRTPS